MTCKIHQTLTTPENGFGHQLQLALSNKYHSKLATRPLSQNHYLTMLSKYKFDLLTCVLILLLNKLIKYLIRQFVKLGFKYLKFNISQSFL